MAIGKAAKFAVQCVGDGASSSFDFLLSATPMWLLSPAPDGVAAPIFNLVSTKPSDVDDLYCNTSGGPSVTSGSITTLGTILHVGLDGAPSNGFVFTILGTLIF